MRPPSESARHWGKMVRELREETGISQRCAASEAGVNRNTLRNIESGKSVATAKDIEALLRVYGYELEAVRADDHDQIAGIAAATVPCPSLKD